MTDAGSDSRSNIRLSDSEREAAVSRLEAHAREGRLSPAEVRERAAAARSAVTRGDLAPVFSDLPADEQASPAAYPSFASPVDQPGAYPGAARGFDAPAKPLADIDRPARRGSTGVLIVSLAPFVALVLFFLTAHFAGFEYAWLWFLLVPVAGLLVYGTGGRDRNRR